MMHSKCPTMSKILCKLSIALSFIFFPPIIYIVLTRIYEWMINVEFIRSMMDSIPDLQFISVLPTILTAIAMLGWTAYVVRNQYNYITRRAFLFKVSKQWSSPEMKAGRDVLHKLYLEASAAKTSHDHIGNKIIAMATDKDKAGEYMDLSNFLDYLETLGYMVARRYICAFELSGVTGHSLANYYKAFEPYIMNLRAKGDEHACYYKNFEMLNCRLTCKKCCMGKMNCSCSCKAKMGSACSKK